MSMSNLTTPCLMGVPFDSEDEGIGFLTLFGGNVDAVHRTGFLALFAADAVLELHVKSHAGTLLQQTFRHDGGAPTFLGLFFSGILLRHRRHEKVLSRHPHALGDGDDRLDDVVRSTFSSAILDV